jgi:hypothetical protein
MLEVMGCPASATDDFDRRERERIRFYETERALAAADWRYDTMLPEDVGR